MLVLTHFNDVQPMYMSELSQSKGFFHCSFCAETNSEFVNKYNLQWGNVKVSDPD